MFINKINSTFFSKRKKSQHKIAFFIYKFLTKIYSGLSASIEDILYKNKSFNNIFYKEGVIKYELSFNANKLLENATEVVLNDSISIYKLREDDIENLILTVFNKDIRSLINEITGFKYSIDYLRIYENKHIEKNNKQFKNIREAHFDKSFSRNMLKIFIPLNIGVNSGPLKVFYINANRLKSIYQKGSKNCKYITGKGNQLYGVLANLCWHQEGNPDKDFSAKQIMFQLNPSDKWEFREDLYSRQLLTENKFSSFSSLFSKNNKIIN